jgi:hypothetical protein
VAAYVISRSLLKQLGGEPEYAAQIAGQIAAGELTAPIDVAHNDQNSLIFEMKKMRDSLVNIVAQVRMVQIPSQPRPAKLQPVTWTCLPVLNSRQARWKNHFFHARTDLHCETECGQCT